MMNDEMPVDLSALDVDADAWRAVMDSTMSRIDEVMAERDTPFVVLSAWRRPLMLAAAVIVALLVPVKYSMELRESDAEPIRALVNVSVQAVHASDVPAAPALLRPVSR